MNCESSFFQPGHDHRGWKAHRLKNLRFGKASEVLATPSASWVLPHVLPLWTNINSTLSGLTAAVTNQTCGSAMALFQPGVESQAFIAQPQGTAVKTSGHWSLRVRVLDDSIPKKFNRKLKGCRSCLSNPTESTESMVSVNPGRTMINYTPHSSTVFSRRPTDASICGIQSCPAQPDPESPTGSGESN